MQPVLPPLVGAIGIVNGLGRLAWSTLSDWMGRASTYVLFFVIETAAFFALAQTPSEALFYILVLTIISCYGGGFSCMPAFLSDLFGVRQLSSIHGIMLTAWALAGIAGPMLYPSLRKRPGATTKRCWFCRFDVGCPRSFRHLESEEHQTLRSGLLAKHASF